MALAFPFLTLRSFPVPNAPHCSPEAVFGELRWTDFTVEPGADIDIRCSCKFIEFEAGRAVFSWVETCPVHPTLPGGGAALGGGGAT